MLITVTHTHTYIQFKTSKYVERNVARNTKTKTKINDKHNNAIFIIIKIYVAFNVNVMTFDILDFKQDVCFFFFYYSYKYAQSQIAHQIPNKNMHTIFCLCCF